MCVAKRINFLLCSIKSLVQNVVNSGNKHCTSLAGGETDSDDCCVWSDLGWWKETGRGDLLFMEIFLCVGNLGTVYPIDYTRVWGKGVKLKCSITDISFELLHNGVQVLSLYSS